MPLYEHTFLARHSLTGQQASALAERFSGVLAENGGSVLDTEYWGLRNLAYRIRNHRKAHYSFFRLDAPAAAVAEMERQMRLSEDVIRSLTVRVDEHEEGPTAVMLARSSRETRRPRRRDADGDGGGGERRRTQARREREPGASEPKAGREAAKAVDASAGQAGNQAEAAGAEPSDDAGRAAGASGTEGDPK